MTDHAAESTSITVSAQQTMRGARRRMSRRITRLIGALTIVIVTGMPVAEAATWTYANKLSVKAYVTRTTVTLSGIRGGTAEIHDFSPEGASPWVHVETYRPAPGYQTVAFARGGGYVSLSHAKAKNARQKCWWVWPWTTKDIGKLKITCKAIS